VPRRPSARLKQQLFDSPAAEAPVHVEAPSQPRLQWLAPATAALVVLCVLMGQRNIPPGSLVTPSKTLVAAALSNQLAAGWLPGSFAHEQNSLPMETFEWTNGNGWSSSTGPLRGPRGAD